MSIFTGPASLKIIAKNLHPHGCYSIQRLRRLQTFTERGTLWQLLAVCILTAMPCIALAALIESVPLAPPEAGPYKNFAFWIRGWIVAFFVDYSALVQMGQSLSRLKMEHQYIVTIALVGSIFSFITVFAVAVWVAFPVPFSMLVASPPSTVVVLVGFNYAWGRRWSADAGLRRDLTRYMMVFVWQVMLTFIYPLYIFGFTSLTGVSQTLFVILLPTIKAVGENWISYTLGEENDIKPEVIIFNVEVFNALYVSCAVQNSTSPSTTVVLMVVDVLHFWFCMTGTMEVASQVKKLMAKIPPDHPLFNANFVELALQLLEIEDRADSSSRTRSHDNQKKLSMVLHKPTTSSKRLIKIDEFEIPTQAVVNHGNPYGSQFFKKIMPTTQIYPIPPDASSTESVRPGPEMDLKLAGPHQGLEIIFTRKERAAFINTTARVLFIAEYLILVEYTEAMLPMVYALYLLIAFYLPNRNYIQTFDGLSDEQFYTHIGYVLTYSILELVSLVIAIAVLKRTLGISSLHQLAFVLKTQASMIQSKLMLWFVYVMQVPLVHVGTDFSFKFKWVHANH